MLRKTSLNTSLLMSVFLVAMVCSVTAGEVIHVDANLVEYAGPVWNFTTVSGQAGVVYPADGAVILGSEIEWPDGSGNYVIYTTLDITPGPTADPDPSVRRGYFSKNYDDVANRVEDANLGPPPWMDPGYYDPDSYYVGLPLDFWEMMGDFYELHVFIPTTGLESLIRGQVYYWTVDETDPEGNVFPGDVWEFAVQDYYAFVPSPPNEAIFIDTDVLLSWLPSWGVCCHRVYIGTSWDEVNNADAADTTGIYKGYTWEPFYQCSNLEFNTKYYWRVDEVSPRSCFPPLCSGPYYKGDVWSFTTISPDLNNDGFIDFLDYAIFANDWQKTGLGHRGDINGDCKVNFVDFAILASGWLDCGLMVQELCGQ